MQHKLIYRCRYQWLKEIHILEGDHIEDFYSSRR